MADGDSRGSGEGGALHLFSQAASSLGNLGLWFLHAARPGDQNAHDGWIGALVEQYRQVFGDLSDLVRGVLERVGQVADPSSGHRLLFRAHAQTSRVVLSEEERALHDFVRKVTVAIGQSRIPDPTAAPNVASVAQPLLSPVVASPALYDQLGDDRLIRWAMRKWPEYAATLDKLLADRNRLDLPRMLEALRHQVRADRVEGFRTVRARLGWMFERVASRSRAIYVLLDRLDDVLGERCMRELLRQRAIKNLLAAPQLPDNWVQDLQTCFAGFGIRLGKRLGVLRAGSNGRPELIVVDCGHDRWFEIRLQGKYEGQETVPACEVYGATEGLVYGLPGEEFRLPLRVQDASQALAAWSVDKRPVQDMLSALPGADRLDLRAWDTGANRTPIALMFVHYREGDLNRYYELGLGCFVAPRRDPLSVGVYMLGTILVSSQRALDIGEAIWGYDKEYVHERAWTVRYRRDFLYCVVCLPGATLSFRVPRSGVLCLPSAVPLLSYTHKPVRNPPARIPPTSDYFEGGQWHRAVLTRFSPRDCVRGAGDGVHLSVKVTDPDQAWRHPLLSKLHALGLLDAQGHPAQPALHCAWTEHMSAHLGPPVLVPTPGEDYD